VLRATFLHLPGIGPATEAELWQSGFRDWRDLLRRTESLGLSSPTRARLAVELASPFGWHRWVGTAGEVLGIERFGASAPYERILQEFGFTAENVATRARAVLARTRGA